MSVPIHWHKRLVSLRNLVRPWMMPALVVALVVASLAPRDATAQMIRQTAGTPVASPALDGTGATLILTVRTCSPDAIETPFAQLPRRCPEGRTDVVFEVMAPQDPAFRVLLAPSDATATMTLTGIPVTGASDVFGIVVRQQEPPLMDGRARAVCRDVGVDGDAEAWAERPVWAPDDALNARTGPGETLECAWYIIPADPATPQVGQPGDRAAGPASGELRMPDRGRHRG